MAIIDRVKERTQTDLTDEEIQMMIDEVNQDIIARYGPHADPENPMAVLLEGNRERIVLPRPVDVTQPITVTEYYDSFGVGESTYQCFDSDFRVWPPYNNTIQRRYDGASNSPRLTWGDRVLVTYVPVNDGDQREEAIIKIVVIGIQYDAFNQQTVGDYSGQTGDYHQERANIMNSIAPRHSLDMA